MDGAQPLKWSSLQTSASLRPVYCSIQGPSHQSEPVSGKVLLAWDSRSRQKRSSHAILSKRHKIAENHSMWGQRRVTNLILPLEPFEEEAGQEWKEGRCKANPRRRVWRSIPPQRRIVVFNPTTVWLPASIGSSAPLPVDVGCSHCTVGPHNHIMSSKFWQKRSECKVFSSSRFKVLFPGCHKAKVLTVFQDRMKSEGSILHPAHFTAQLSSLVSNWHSYNFHAQPPRCVSNKCICTHLCAHGHVALKMRCDHVHCWRIAILRQQKVIIPLTNKKQV